MSKTTWPAAQSSQPLAAVMTRHNVDGIRRMERLRELQEIDNGYAAKFGRVSRRIIDPVPFGDELSVMPLPSLMIASPKGQAAARVRRERMRGSK